MDSDLSPVFLQNAVRAGKAASVGLDNTRELSYNIPNVRRQINLVRKEAMYYGRKEKYSDLCGIEKVRG